MDNKHINSRFIREYLFEQGISFEYIAYKHEPTLTLERMAQKLFIPPHLFARVFLLRDDHGYAMAILSASDRIDFSAIRQVSGRDFEVAWPEDYASLFPAMQTQFIPPLSALFDLECFIDSRLVESADIYIPDGSNKGVIKLSSLDFMAFQASPRVLKVGIDSVTDEIDISASLPDRAQQVRDSILQLDSLPPMPAVAAELLKLSRDPEVRSANIARVIEQDPAIVALILRYASSSMYGFRGKIESVERAIFSVLGLNMVTNLALGLAAGKAFKIPSEGALTGKELWRQPVYCASICEGLARATTSRLGIKPGTAYLSGLLHNIGFMVLAHCLPKQFTALSKQVEESPETAITEIENALNGITHAEIGAELMHHWELPEQILTVMKYHHDEDYSGEYSNEVALVLVANRLLLSEGIGDEVTADIPAHILDRLGITLRSACLILDNVMAKSDEHEVLISKLVA